MIIHQRIRKLSSSVTRILKAKWILFHMCMQSSKFAFLKLREWWHILTYFACGWYIYVHIYSRTYIRIINKIITEISDFWELPSNIFIVKQASQPEIRLFLKLTTIEFDDPVKWLLRSLMNTICTCSDLRESVTKIKTWLLLF